MQNIDQIAQQIISEVEAEGGVTPTVVRTNEARVAAGTTTWLYRVEAEGTVTYLWTDGTLVDGVLNVTAA